jgi:hypothetical protein
MTCDVRYNDCDRRVEMNGALKDPEARTARCLAASYDMIL